MPRSERCLPFGHISLNLVAYAHEVASIPQGEVSRETMWGPTDELHQFTKSSETDLGLSTDSTVLFSCIRKFQVK